MNFVFYPFNYIKMKYLKEFFQKNLFPIWIILPLLLASCDSDSSDPESGNSLVTVSSIKLNDQILVDGANNISTASTLEIVFSSGIDPEKFRNSFSITSSAQAVNYSPVFTNASSKVTLNLPTLAPATSYTLEIKSGVLGRSGEQLQNTIIRSFITLEENNSGQKTPCLTGANCEQKIFVENNSGSSFIFDFLSSFDFVEDEEYVWEQLEEVIFIVHGQNRDAIEYFTYMTNTVRSLDLQNKTLVIAPNFRESSSESNGLFWDNNWREGANAENVSSNLSSFSVMDSILKRLSDPQKFPNLKKVIITGHSSGATYVQHYALAGKSENLYENLEFKYVVANNQYFYYPDDKRYNEDSNEFFTPTDCSGYNFWPYGFDFAIPYLNGIDKATILEQQISRNTTYLLGANDTSTSGTLNTTDCAAILLGSNRFKRGENMFRYIETFYNGQHDHHKIIVPNVGHDGEAIFSSPEFKAYLEENIDP